MSKIEIGCCCAHCKTCRAFRDGHCRGCKLDYDNGKRDIRRAKCKIKLCCFQDRQLTTCADCDDFTSCLILQPWYKKKAGKYQRYKQSAEFIRAHGYNHFIKIANKWNDACGRLK